MKKEKDLKTKEGVREVLLAMIEETFLSSVNELIDSATRDVRVAAREFGLESDELLIDELNSHLARERNKIISECATSTDIKKMEFAMKMIGTESQRERQNSVYKAKEDHTKGGNLPTIVMMDAGDLERMKKERRKNAENA